MNKKKFDGSISEIMVAYKPNGDLDFEPVKKMVEFQVENHIDGLFMGGLSTQTYLLSMEEKKQVLSLIHISTDALCANTLIDQGCDLICIDLSSSAVAQVCEERGVKFIGSSVDMREFAPTQQLTSNCWTWGPWMAKQVEAVREGNFKGVWCELDINDGAISLADYSDAVPQNVIDMIEEQKQKFMDGEEVFVGPLYDNTGKLRVPEGESLTGEAANSMQ